MGELSIQQKELYRYAVGVLKPKPKLTGSEWADRYFYLSPESSSVPGKWVTRPWQRDILNAMTDSDTSIVVIKKPTRVGFTKMLNIVHAYFIDQKPCVQLHYQPNDDEAKGYAEDEFEPMVRDNDRIKKLVYMPVHSGRKKKEKTTKKNYPGGYIEVMGSQSDRNLNRRTAKVAVGDEVDTWVKESGDAGDTVTMMMRRTSDFWDRKNILGGKPVGKAYNSDEGRTKETSTIDYWYHKGSMEIRYLPCPHCGEMQTFGWNDMSWDVVKDDDGNIVDELPDTAHFICVKCKDRIYDHHKIDMDRNGEWIATNENHDGIRSFHLWAFLSYSPNVKWSDIVREYIDARDDKMKLKAFYNEVLAEPFEESIEAHKGNELEVLRTNIDPWEVPDRTAFLTMAVDVQLDHFWIDVWAHQFGGGSCSIRHERVETWVEVEDAMRYPYVDTHGSRMNVRACPVDSGFKKDEVYDFCSMNSDVAFPVKGASSSHKQFRITTLDNGLKLYLIDVEFYKDMFWAKVERSIKVVNDGAKSESIHVTHKEAKLWYFNQLASEHKVTETDKRGRIKTYWKKRKSKIDNHLFDTSVYNQFVGDLLGIRFLRPDDIRKSVSKKKKRPRQSTDHMDEF